MSITGSCHCGTVQFTIDGQLPDSLTRCTCSFCAKRGALPAHCTPAHRTSPDAGNEVYRWNSKLVAHHFCASCGCATFSDSPAFERNGDWDGSTRRIGVNARLFDDDDAATEPVTVIDGKHLWQRRTGVQRTPSSTWIARLSVQSFTFSP